MSGQAPGHGEEARKFKAGGLASSKEAEYLGRFLDHDVWHVLGGPEDGNLYAAYGDEDHEYVSGLTNLLRLLRSDPTGSTQELFATGGVCRGVYATVLAVLVSPWIACRLIMKGTRLGARFFTSMGRGRDAEEAARRAIEDALCDHGRAGYTGTIAEKVGCRLQQFPLPEDVAPDSDGRFDRDELREAASLHMDDPAIDDKWRGAIGYFALGQSPEAMDGVQDFFFFGLASS